MLMTNPRDAASSRLPGVLAILLALVGVLPFVLLGLHAHPSADDWYMAADTLEKGFVKANVDYYNGTTGRFTSSAFLFMNPIILSFGAFKCYSVCLVLSLVLAARWAVSSWFPGQSSAWKWAAALLGVTLLLWGMASTAQGFYWGTGSSGYTLPAVIALVIAALTGRRSLEPGWKPSVVVVALMGLLAVVATGCTEVAMALLLLHALGWNALFVWRNRRVSKPLAVLLLAIGVGAALVMLSPGNANRSSLYSNGVNHVLPAALMLTLKLGVKHVGSWLVHVPFVPFSLIALCAWPAARMVPRKQAVELIVLALLLMAGGVFGAFFLGAWSMGAALPLRAVNLILFFFIIDWFVLLAGLVGLLRSLELRLPQSRVLFSLGLVLAIGMAVVFPGNNVRNAWRDLVGGEAARYDQESTMRHATLRAASPDAAVRVPALTARPSTLFFNDLTPDPTDWRNTGCARFFRKHSVAVTSPAPTHP